jgi:hypothetical protein
LKNTSFLFGGPRRNEHNFNFKGIETKEKIKGIAVWVTITTRGVSFPKSRKNRGFSTKPY